MHIYCVLVIYSVKQNSIKRWTQDYADDTALLVNAPIQAKSQLLSLEKVAGGNGLDVNADKMEYICFDQKGYICTLNSISLKFVDKFTELSSSISSTESDINMHLAKVWTAIDRL